MSANFVGFHVVLSADYIPQHPLIISVEIEELTLIVRQHEKQQVLMSVMIVDFTLMSILLMFFYVALRAK